MAQADTTSFAFNSALETGVRSLGILVAAHPAALDLQRLVAFDHLVVHTGDIGGPESLHPKLPLRSAEILVRRGLVERGLMLMLSKELVERRVGNTGIAYEAGEFAETFLNSLTSPYLVKLNERAQWVASIFGHTSEDEFRLTVDQVFNRWIEEFHVVEKTAEVDL